MLSKNWWRPDEVADYFRVSMDTVYRWVRRGSLDGRKINGVIRISRGSIEALMDKKPMGSKINFSG
jgi:excisionase family DNA binding protein